MNNGPTMIIPGSILGSMFLVVVLLLVTSGFSYPDQANHPPEENETNINTSSKVNQSEANPQQDNSPSCTVSKKHPPRITKDLNRQDPIKILEKAKLTRKQKITHAAIVENSR